MYHSREQTKKINKILNAKEVKPKKKTESQIFVKKTNKKNK